MKNKISLLLIILYSCFITSCDDNFNKSELLDSIENQISFDVTIENELETKGAPVISVDDESFNKVGVFGYHTENNFDNIENATSSYIPNIPIEKKTGKWGFKTNYFWPQKGYVTFFAYAPYDAEGVEIADIPNGKPTLK